MKTGLKPGTCPAGRLDSARASRPERALNCPQSVQGQLPGFCTRGSSGGESFHSEFEVNFEFCWKVVRVPQCHCLREVACGIEVDALHSGGCFVNHVLRRILAGTCQVRFPGSPCGVALVAFASLVPELTFPADMCPLGLHFGLGGF